MTDPLFRLRKRLIAWYVGVFAAVLVLFGVSTLLVVENEITEQLDRSLSGAVDAIERASAIREQETLDSTGAVDAFDELRIPGRDLYVFDGAGALLHPTDAPAWLVDVAAQARSRGQVSLVHEDATSDRAWRVNARGFRELATGATLVGVAVADNVEVEARYPRLVIAFSLAGALALLLVALGGGWLAHRATRPAEAALDQMRRFTADAAHQLRTPLSVIRSRGEVALRRERDPDEYRSALLDVSQEASRLGSVVEKLLLLARADAGEVALRRERVFLDDVVEEALVTLRPLAREREVSLDVDVHQEVPLEGDAMLLGQLVIVLVDNALQFSPPGRRVSVRVEASSGRARLVVQDEGPGIPPDQVDLVFERFYRGDPTRGRESGAGLGLSIGRWIVEAHGGTLRLHPREGGGTTATVDLPSGLADFR